MIVTIPDSFRCVPFFLEETVSISMTENTFPNVLWHVPFYYDLTGEQEPWLNKRLYVPQLLRLWQEAEPLLLSHYQKRQPKAAKETMINMIAVYIDALFWSNNKRVSSVKEIFFILKDLNYQPVNCEERLSFLLTAPEHYHTYVQLKAMFTELGKMYAKILVLEQRNQKNN